MSTRTTLRAYHTVVMCNVGLVYVVHGNHVTVVQLYIPCGMYNVVTAGYVRVMTYTCNVCFPVKLCYTYVIIILNIPKQSTSAYESI